MNAVLAALEETISKKAREAAIREVGKLFQNLEQDLYHLGLKNFGEELRPMQTKVVELVTHEKACLLAEELLRRQDTILKAQDEKEALAKSFAEDVIIIDEEVDDDR
jgi:molybdopterin converting factor small subunit